MKNLSISIIGFGAAGTSVFVQLIKKLESKKIVGQNLIINIFEKENKLTRGIAYSSDQPSSLLNTKVNRSSIFGDGSSHFFNWVKKNIHTLSEIYPDLSNLSEDSFLPRSLFGMYLDQTFEYYANVAKNLNIKVNILMDEVIDIVEEECNTFLYTKTGHKLITNKIIFSTGHIYSSTFKKFENVSNFFNTPYPESTVLNSISKEKNILIIGSRLTAIDLAMAFLSKQHKGKITLASRSGLMPMIRSEPFNYTPKFISPATIKKNINLDNIITLLQAEFQHLYADQPFSSPLKESGCRNDFINEYFDTMNHLSHWQNLASMFDEFIEACWVNIADNERMTFIEKFLPLLTRYTATIPHETASLIIKHFLSNQLLLENSLLNINGTTLSLSIF